MDARVLERPVETAEQTIRVTGVVKWFDITKGYGFVVPDDGGKDVHIHISILRDGGFETASAGSRVTGDAFTQPKGLSMSRVISVVPPDESFIPNLRQPSTHARATNVGAFEIVVVKWFNRERGFGFLTRGEGTEDIFVHMETMRCHGFVDPQPDDTMLARFGLGPKGLVAAEVRPLSRQVTNK